MGGGRAAFHGANDENFNNLTFYLINLQLSQYGSRIIYVIVKTECVNACTLEPAFYP